AFRFGQRSALGTKLPSDAARPSGVLHAWELPAVAAISVAIAIASATTSSIAVATAPTIASITAVAESTATAPPRPPIPTLLRFVDTKRAAFEVRTVERLNRLLSRLRRRHRNEGESARSAGLSVEHELDLDDVSDLLEGPLDRLFGGLE